MKSKPSLLLLAASAMLGNLSLATASTITDGKSGSKRGQVANFSLNYFRQTAAGDSSAS
ncbi:MAG: hypothetical protein Q8N18_08720 [Opitutaceae bacterium]|nr:hypothetical protein [Opitutaceae bacterium]